MLSNSRVRPNGYLSYHLWLFSVDFDQVLLNYIIFSDKAVQLDSIKKTLDQKVEPLGEELALNFWLNSCLEGVQIEMLL